MTVETREMTRAQVAVLWLWARLGSPDARVNAEQAAAVLRVPGAAGSAGDGELSPRRTDGWSEERPKRRGNHGPGPLRRWVQGGARPRGRDSLIREMFEALAEWEKHGVGCYCSACEVLRPAFDEWQRLAAVTASVSRETDAAEQPKRRRGRSAA